MFGLTFGKDGFHIGVPGVATLGVLAATFSAQGCGNIQHLDGTPLMKAHFILKMEGSFHIGIPMMYTVEIKATTDLFLNLDADDDCYMAAPGAVLRSFLESSCPYDESSLEAKQMDWAIGLKQEIEIAVVLYGMIKLGPPGGLKVTTLFYMASSANQMTTEVAFQIQAPGSLKQMFGETFVSFVEKGETFLGMTICGEMNALGVNKSMNPFCEEFAFWSSRVTIKAVMKKSKGRIPHYYAEVDYDVGNSHKLTVERRSDKGDSWEFCVDEECFPFSYCLESMQWVGDTLDWLGFSTTADSIQMCDEGYSCCNNNCKRNLFACCENDNTAANSGKCLDSSSINWESNACPEGWKKYEIGCSAAAHESCEEDKNCFPERFPTDSCAAHSVAKGKSLASDKAIEGTPPTNVSAQSTDMSPYTATCLARKQGVKAKANNHFLSSAASRTGLDLIVAFLPVLTCFNLAIVFARQE